MNKDEKKNFSNYDSDNAKSLLNKLNIIENDISSIKISNIISSFDGNISPETKARFGNIENYLSDPNKTIKPIITNAIDILSNAIYLLEKTDNEKVDFNLLLLISGYLNINMLPDNYKFDVNVLFEGKMYTMFSQNGYSEDDLLHYYTFIFTDGNKGSGYGHTVAGASCSMVAFLNGMVELYSLDEVMNMFGLKELSYIEDLTVKNQKSYHSLNESFLLSVNEKLTSEYLKEHPESNYDDIETCVSRGPGEVIYDDKIKGIEFAINNNFKDKVNYQIIKGFQNLSFEEKKEINEKLANGDAFIEFRLKKNTGSETWTHTGYGHYITAVDYKIIDGEECYLIKDSAVNIDIDNSMINTMKDYDKARLAWRSVKELEGAINENSINAIVVSKKEGVNINEWKI